MYTHYWKMYVQVIRIYVILSEKSLMSSNLNAKQECNVIKYIIIICFIYDQLMSS